MINFIIFVLIVIVFLLILKNMKEQNNKLQENFSHKKIPLNYLFNRPCIADVETSGLNTPEIYNTNQPYYIPPLR